MEFGFLVAPLEGLALRDTTPTLEEFRTGFRMFNKADITRWQRHLEDFRTIENFVIPHYGLEWPNEIVGNLESALYVKDVDLASMHELVRERLESMKRQLFELVNVVPVKWNANMYRANSPFTVYGRIQDALAGANRRVD